MALPHKLKNMNLYNDGVSYLGLVPEVSIPKLARKMEGYRGNFDAEIPIDMGGEPIEFEWKASGLIEQIYGQFGMTTIDGVQLRWVGGYQDDQTGRYKTVEIVVRGRHGEIDPGSGKPGDDTEESVKTVCVYYKLTVDGRTLIEKDEMNLVFIVNGVDRLAEQRAAIGL
ncbi:phage major tail tube protein [Sphingopyxis yananensis]|uniref:phage major tail tube protein n=1 Tax=Sphingopyxis yananensis TaxID=2886687 RepID=UPI001D12930B|nr:phage major tail tube protein [Sphingopyxis yananensis]MCC2602740.1 phage major tail tube protein [Sphingopyxis yananensis]